MQKKFLIILLPIVILICICSNVFATDETTYTTTSIINGVTVNWTYKLNDSNEIEELICTNASELSGNITIPETLDDKKVVALGFKSFQGAPITGVTFSENLVKIGPHAFLGCTNLRELDLGDGIQYLGINAFENCTSLTSLYIPKSLTEDCGNHPFAGCDNITSVTFEEGIPVIPAFICQDLTGITEITIPNSVTKIGGYAFSGCTNLKKITILDNVKNIGINVFEDHNEDLTIYCYEGSVAAQYAIDNNIKYVYLARQPQENSGEDEPNVPGEPEPDEGNGDNTVIKDDKLPDTGEKIAVLIGTLAMVAIAIVAYKKYNNYKEI